MAASDNRRPSGGHTLFRYTAKDIDGRTVRGTMEAADYDALYAQAQTCYDDGEQADLYKELEKNLTDNAANVYIQDMADFVAVRDGLEGPDFYPIYVLDLSTFHYAK